MSTIDTRVDRKADGAPSDIILAASRNAFREENPTATVIIDREIPLYQFEENDEYLYVQGREILPNELKIIRNDLANRLSASSGFIVNPHIIRVPAGFYNRWEERIPKENVIQKDSSNTCFILGKPVSENEANQIFPDGTCRGSIVIKIKRM